MDFPFRNLENLHAEVTCLALHEPGPDGPRLRRVCAASARWHYYFTESHGRDRPFRAVAHAKFVHEVDNAFYKKIFIHEKDVLIKIEKDLNRLTKSSTSLRFVKKFPSEPNSLKLNTSLRQFSKPNHPIRFDGFRSICPVTSQPDFAIIYIYTNAKIDLKWLKIFLRSFKEKGEFHEQCIEDIFVSIEKKYPDFCIEVCGRFLRRGGIDINPIRSSKKTFHFKNFRVFNQ